VGLLALAEANSDPLLEQLVAEIHARGLEVPNLYLTIGNAPKMLQAWMGFTWPLRGDASSPRSLRELVIMRVAHSRKADYMWAHHWPMAIANGFTAAQLEGLGEWRARDLFNESESLVLRYTEDVISGNGVDAATFAEMRSAFSPLEIVELTLSATFYLNLAYFATALDIELEPSYVKYAEVLGH
jgi:alkylhydroperoxidase family enzyme